jgi:hypothetical protein
MMLSTAMNGFYGAKRLTGNEPADARDTRETIEHPAPGMVPARLVPLRKQDRSIQPESTSTSSSLSHSTTEASSA